MESVSVAGEKWGEKRTRGSMKIVADENVERLVIMKLRRLGYQVKDSRETGKRISDREILSSLSGDEVFLTHDRDFLNAEGVNVILLSTGWASADETVELVEFLHQEGYLARANGKMVVKLRGRIVSIAQEEILEKEGE